MFVCSALRTPVTRARRGGLKDVHAELMLATVLKGILEKTKIDPKLIEDVVVGNVLPPGGGATVARMACLYAGYFDWNAIIFSFFVFSLPESSSVMTVNRQCSSGLQAVAQVAAAIKAGFINIGIGAGVESMTMHYGPGAMAPSVCDKVSSLKSAADCLTPMGITSENVAAEYKITREQQDQLAALSHQKAAKAQKDGLFKDEIVPCEGVSEDDGIRAETTVAGLSKLKASFRENGSTTAGNSSQVSDGAAGVLLMRRSVAERLKLPILGKTRMNDSRSFLFR